MGQILNCFSVVLPVRNGGEYVKECVNSILAQTYSNFNLIVLDNCSTDGTREWIEELNNAKIIIYPSEISLSIEQNWARVVALPKNEFITLIGHDDLLFPSYLQTMNDLINEYPDASLYQSHFNFIDSKGDLIRQCKQMPNYIDANKFIEMFLTIRMDSMGTGYLMRSRDYDKIGGIPTHYPQLLFADFELWLNLTDLNYQAISPLHCFAFRLHQSTTTTTGNTKFLIAFETFIGYLKLKLNDSRLKLVVEQNILNYIQFYCQGLTHRLIKTPGNKREKGERVKDVLYRCKVCANLLIPNNSFDPAKKWTVKIALLIDNNFLFKRIFLLFKNIYKKPVLK